MYKANWFDQSARGVVRSAHCQLFSSSKLGVIDIYVINLQLYLNLMPEIYIFAFDILKGLLHGIFRPFLACMDTSRPECEPLVVVF